MDNKKADFLSVLRRKNNKGNSENTAELKYPIGLRVMVYEKSGEVRIRLVDEKGKNCRASDYEQIGSLGPLLKIMTEITGGGSMDFHWTQSGVEDSVITANYPFLTQYLASCRHLLVDSKNNPLGFDDELHSVTYKLTKSVSGGNNGVYKGAFEIDGKKIKGFVSPDMVLTSEDLVSVKNVGERFADLKVFSTEFDADMLEIFLSIFYSTVENVYLNFGDYRIILSDKEVPFQPTLVIEKIDSDNSLCLRVTETAGNLPSDICENFKLVKIAMAGGNTIYIRRLSESTIPMGIEAIQEALSANAGKREMREVWRSDNLYVIPPEIASRFLYNSFAGLLSVFKVLGADKLKSYKIVAGRPKLNVRLGSGIDYLEGKATVEVGGENFTLRDLLAEYGRNKYITLSDGNRAVMDSAYMRRLQRIFSSGGKKGSDDVKISFFDLPEVMELLDAKEKESKVFDKYRKFYDGFNELSAKKVLAPGLKAKLRDYQKEGVKWINYLYSTKMGGCLADDMGLGKTVQTIGMLCRSVPKAKYPTLVVMPRSLIFNWQEEFTKFAPHIKLSIYYGPSRDLEESMRGEVILTSYAMVRNDIEKLMKKKFDYIILDESQNIKNVDAMVTKAVWLLKADHRLAISGTPIENNLTELYSLFHFLNPAMFGPLKDFMTKYVIPIQKEGDEDAADSLRRKVFPFILRRLKKDVLKDLPERTEQTLIVEMIPRQAALYEERRRYYADEVGKLISTSGAKKASFELLQALLELRQIASVPEAKSNGTVSSPKIETLMEHLVPAVANGHKVVVFFNFLTGIELTGERLNKAGVDYEVMTGSTRDRKKVVDRFQNDPECKVMLMTVKTGGVGLNLVAADTVFIMEPWWNKAAEEQAINRLHRIGQKKSVNCYYLITADTIEEKIRQLQQQKSQLVDAVISSDTTDGKSLSAEDIEFLLK
ncbi:MAG: DEAD/DEAH box helicase [Muribaculum sp.]|nr:DEAD/DEAH box helicase [Muribaculum sp.]